MEKATAKIPISWANYLMQPKFLKNSATILRGRPAKGQGAESNIRIAGRAPADKALKILNQKELLPKIFLASLFLPISSPIFLILKLL